jgi:3-hydroxyacyl-[acyl-carrier-protein] dehydratase
MTARANSTLRLGSNVVELLLPQKRPFLMVDFVSAFRSTPVPALESGRHVSANEAFFDGHFPGMHVWPGTLTIEGLGQTSALLMAIIAMRRVAEGAGVEPDVVLDRLNNLDRGFRMHPGHKADDALDLVRQIRAEPPSLAIGASVDVKFIRPVFAGQRLDYLSELVGEVGNMMRFRVEARVDDAPVVSGTLTGARVPRSAAVSAAFA